MVPRLLARRQPPRPARSASWTCPAFARPDPAAIR
jgi:hypothetical protein